jgi:hypothetical protein
MPAQGPGPQFIINLIALREDRARIAQESALLGTVRPFILANYPGGVPPPARLQ